MATPGSKEVVDSRDGMDVILDELREEMQAAQTRISEEISRNLGLSIKEINFKFINENLKDIDCAHLIELTSQILLFCKNNHRTSAGELNKDCDKLFLGFLIRFRGFLSEDHNAIDLIGSIDSNSLECLLTEFKGRGTVLVGCGEKVDSRIRDLIYEIAKRVSDFGNDRLKQQMIESFAGYEVKIPAEMHTLGFCTNSNEIKQAIKFAEFVDKQKALDLRDEFVVAILTNDTEKLKSFLQLLNYLVERSSRVEVLDDKQSVISSLFTKEIIKNCLKILAAIMSDGKGIFTKDEDSVLKSIRKLILPLMRDVFDFGTGEQRHELENMSLLPEGSRESIFCADDYFKDLTDYRSFVALQKILKEVSGRISGKKKQESVGRCLELLQPSDFKRLLSKAISRGYGIEWVFYFTLNTGSAEKSLKLDDLNNEPIRQVFFDYIYNGFRHIIDSLAMPCSNDSGAYVIDKVSVDAMLRFILPLFGTERLALLYAQLFEDGFAKKFKGEFPKQEVDAVKDIILKIVADSKVESDFYTALLQDFDSKFFADLLKLSPDLLAGIYNKLTNVQASELFFAIVAKIDSLSKTDETKDEKRNLENILLSLGVNKFEIFDESVKDPCRLLDGQKNSLYDYFKANLLKDSRMLSFGIAVGAKKFYDFINRIASKQECQDVLTMLCSLMPSQISDELRVGCVSNKSTFDFLTNLIAEFENNGIKVEDDLKKSGLRSKISELNYLLITKDKQDKESKFKTGDEQEKTRKEEIETNNAIRLGFTPDDKSFFALNRNIGLLLREDFSRLVWLYDGNFETSSSISEGILNFLKACHDSYEGRYDVRYDNHICVVTFSSNYDELILQLVDRIEKFAFDEKSLQSKLSVISSVMSFIIKELVEIRKNSAYQVVSKIDCNKFEERIFDICKKIEKYEVTSPEFVELRRITRQFILDMMVRPAQEHKTSALASLRDDHSLAIEDEAEQKRCKEDKSVKAKCTILLDKTGKFDELPFVDLLSADFCAMLKEKNACGELKDFVVIAGKRIDLLVDHLAKDSKFNTLFYDNVVKLYKSDEKSEFLGVIKPLLFSADKQITAIGFDILKQAYLSPMFSSDGKKIIGSLEFFNTVLNLMISESRDANKEIILETLLRTISLQESSWDLVKKNIEDVLSRIYESTTEVAKVDKLKLLVKVVMNIISTLPSKNVNETTFALIVEYVSVKYNELNTEEKSEINGKLKSFLAHLLKDYISIDIDNTEDSIVKNFLERIGLPTWIKIYSTNTPCFSNVRSYMHGWEKEGLAAYLIQHSSDASVVPLVFKLISEPADSKSGFFLNLGNVFEKNPAELNSLVWNTVNGLLEGFSSKNHMNDWSHKGLFRKLLDLLVIEPDQSSHQTAVTAALRGDDSYLQDNDDATSINKVRLAFAKQCLERFLEISKTLVGISILTSEMDMLRSVISTYISLKGTDTSLDFEIWKLVLDVNFSINGTTPADDAFKTQLARIASDKIGRGLTDLVFSKSETRTIIDRLNLDKACEYYKFCETKKPSVKLILNSLDVADYDMFIKLLVNTDQDLARPGESRRIELLQYCDSDSITNCLDQFLQQQKYYYSPLCTAKNLAEILWRSNNPALSVFAEAKKYVRQSSERILSLMASDAENITDAQELNKWIEVIGRISPSIENSENRHVEERYRYSRKEFAKKEIAALDKVLVHNSRFPQIVDLANRQIKSCYETLYSNEWFGLKKHLYYWAHGISRTRHQEEIRDGAGVVRAGLYMIREAYVPAVVARPDVPAQVTEPVADRAATHSPVDDAKDAPVVHYSGDPMPVVPDELRVEAAVPAKEPALATPVAASVTAAAAKKDVSGMLPPRSGVTYWEHELRVEVAVPAKEPALVTPVAASVTAAAAKSELDLGSVSDGEYDATPKPRKETTALTDPNKLCDASAPVDLFNASAVGKRVETRVQAAKDGEKVAAQVIKDTAADSKELTGLKAITGAAANDVEKVLEDARESASRPKTGLDQDTKSHVAARPIGDTPLVTVTL